MDRATPGVYREELVPALPVNVPTGVPAIFGFADNGPFNQPRQLRYWPDLSSPPRGVDGYTSYVASAIRAFFNNGGHECYWVALDSNIANSDPLEALDDGLASIATIDDIDLVCVPDIMMTCATIDCGLPPPHKRLRFKPEQIHAMQQRVLDFCGSGGHNGGMGVRFAILDALPSATTHEVRAQRDGLAGSNGALYYPWIGAVATQRGTVEMMPPCGHLAGVYARTDEQIGVHAAPANKPLNDAVALVTELTNAQQGPLNDDDVNCLRAFPGRGILVWGARCLANRGLEYVNQRRLMITLARWLALNMRQFAFEPNEPELWGRIARELTVHLDAWFVQGALAGATAEQAFYVKCDAQTNPPSVRAQGKVVAEVGLAPTFPAEFVVVKIIHDSSGTYLTRDVSDLN